MGPTNLSTLHLTIEIDVAIFEYRLLYFGLKFVSIFLFLSRTAYQW